MGAALCAAIISLTGLTALAQTPPPSAAARPATPIMMTARGQNVSRRARRLHGRARPRQQQQQRRGAITNVNSTPVAAPLVSVAPSASASSPISVVPPPAQPEYLMGQAQVAVRGNHDPVIRLGLAQHGPTVVEFPASDNFFAVHPGGSNIVTYDESPTLATDHYLVFRAGSGFGGVAEGASAKSEARASISVQMQSGLFVTFLFYPVRDVARMAHRCVVTYSRDEVVAVRRAAGLAVNLDGKTSQATPMPETTSRRVITSAMTAASANNLPMNADATSSSISGATATREGASILLESGELVPSALQRDSNRRKRSVDLRDETRRALREALALPTKFTRWSAPAYGLSVAAIAPVDLDAQRRLTVVAVKNTTANGLRLVAGGPDIDVQTLNEAGQIVQVRSVNRLHTEASTLDGAIPAGASVYYAIIYEAPVLDSAQRVRLSVAHTSAADRPASAELSVTN